MSAPWGISRGSFLTLISGMRNTRFGASHTGETFFWNIMHVCKTVSNVPKWDLPILERDHVEKAKTGLLDHSCFYERAANVGKTPCKHVGARNDNIYDVLRCLLFPWKLPTSYETTFDHTCMCDRSNRCEIQFFYFSTFLGFLVQRGPALRKRAHFQEPIFRN